MSRTRAAAPPDTPASVAATSYGELCDALKMFELGAGQAQTFWLRHLKAPPAVVDRAVTRILEEGYVSAELSAQLAPYCSSRETTRTEQIRALIDAADARRWQRHRIAIVPDPDLWQDMATIEDTDTLSADVFQWLPYENPYIHLPQPMVLPTADPQRQHRVYGAYLYGVRRDPHHLLCSTADPRAFTIGFKLAGAITDLHGRPEYMRAEWDASVMCPDAVWTNIILWFQRPEMTFGELAAASTRNFESRDPGGGRAMLHDSVASAQAALQVVRPLLAFVNYLCCSNADLEIRKPTKPHRAKRRQADSPPPPVMVRAGFQIGAAIRAWRTEQASTAARTPTGRTVRPHPRRGHFHRFRHGPGRTLLSQPKYLPMTWVNWRDRTGDVTIKPATGR